ncbi:ABC transporter ATP-binding protein [Nonomuraea longicatena]|uniref:ABC transporter ATP-binding protein n=1 Tax=Nonomuraea longicatena TaxID=83682 RepID=A0ABN1PCX2_9ACTN
MTGGIRSRLLWRALRREPYQLVRLGGWSVLEAAPAFLIGLAVARAIEDGFAAGRPETGLAWLAALGVTWAVAAFAARQVVLAVAAIAEPFRDDLLAHVVRGALRTATAAHALRPDSAAVARAGLQVELARDAFAALVTTLRGFAFTVISVVLGLLTLAPGAAALVLPPFAAGLGLFLASLPRLIRQERAYLVADEELTKAMTSMSLGLRDIVACGAEEQVGARVEDHVGRQAGAARAVAKVTAIRTAALAVGGWLPVVCLLAGTPWLVRDGAGAGVVVGALAYVTQSLAPALGGLVQGLGASGVRLAASLERITGSAGPEPGPASPEPVTGSVGPEAGAASPEPVTGSAAPEPGPTTTVRVLPPVAEVELREVTFAYGPHADPVLDRFDLHVREGERLAVVGPSGAGKSTLAALVSGLLRPDAGEVSVGGVPAHRVDRRGRVLIPQEAYVFRGSLLENLAYLGDPSRSEIEAVLAVLGADRLGDLDGQVDPAALSAGQRQLIALARAYLAPARLVVLDEATCHLDPAAEARVEAAFAERGGTLIVVAHRLSSAQRADRVLLMDGARVQLGTHDELVRISPDYADLVGHWKPERTS